ncbi:hypothetical protein [Mesorhizobium sp. M0767]|uniref:hypothetical protein n=1 Tax=Mesorhizobium sp. M0767 TaxID=2956995 RepID=UPI0033353351
MASETADYTLPSKNPFALSMDSDSPTVAKINTATTEFDSDDLKKEKTADVPTESDESGLDGDNEGDAAGGDEPAGELEALPDFNAEDADNVAAYDERYTLEDGTIDLEGSLTTEFWANKEAGKEGLNDATYAYLQTKGISKATIKQVEAMAITNKDAANQGVVAQDGKLFEIAGGSDKLALALAWGKAGGYDAAAQARFNKATKGTDFEAKQDAVEALMARYNRANPAKKPTLPARDGTKGQGKGGNQAAVGFKDRAEMRSVRDALKQGDLQGWANYNRRRAASKF